MVSWTERKSVLKRPNPFSTAEADRGKKAKQVEETQWMGCLFDMVMFLAASIRDEFMARFKGAEVSVVLNGIAAFDPKSSAFLTEDALLAMAKHYHYKGAKVTRLQAEVTNFRFNFEDPDNQASELTTSVCVIHYLFDNKGCYPTLSSLGILALSLPATSVPCERSFSAMRRIKTYLRNRTGDDRISHLAILDINKAVAQSIYVTIEMISSPDF